MAISQEQFDRIVRDMPGFGRDPASVRRRIEMMEAVLERVKRLTRDGLLCVDTLLHEFFLQQHRTTHIV